MPIYQYHCLTCQRELEIYLTLKEYVPVISCPCGGGAVRVYTNSTFSISGSQDGYWLKNKFVDKKTGRLIDSWKKWEKAGYRKPEEVVPDNGDGTLHAEIKRKQEKMKYYDTKKRFSVVMGGTDAKR